MLTPYLLFCFIIFLPYSHAEPLTKVSESTKMRTAPMNPDFLSDANCPKGWTVVVDAWESNLGFNCVSKKCSCFDEKKSDCKDNEKRLLEFHMPKSNKSTCETTPEAVFAAIPREAKCLSAYTENSE